uniref:C2H2-type domain-containing protein n=1 Tax=Strongyloides venezuelensis TaxID=75913 RepID=A0A0K0F139_STRVS
MGFIHCSPSIHEFTLDYHGKKYFAEIKRLQNIKKQHGINSPIKHYPYLCEEDNCELRFMFYSDMVYHLQFHHNIYDRKLEMKKMNFFSHNYTLRKRKEDEFFTINELMKFTEDDFKKFNVLHGRKRKSSTCIEKPYSLKKVNVSSSMCKIESLLKDFVFTNENSKNEEFKNLHATENIENEISTQSQCDIIYSSDDIKHVEENNENKKDIMLIDLTNISDDETSETCDWSVNKNDQLEITIQKTNCSNSISVNEFPPNLSMNNCEDSITANQSSYYQHLSNTNNEEIQKKTIETKQLKNLKILSTENNSKEYSKSCKILLSNSLGFNKKLKSPKYNKENVGSFSCEVKKLKHKKNQKKNEKEVIEKINKLLCENVPKENNHIENTKDSNTFKKQKNTKQTNEEIMMLQNDSQCQLLSITSTSNTNISAPLDTTSGGKISKWSSKMKGIYHCIFNKECNFITKYRINYEKHITEHGVVRAFYRCSVCSLVFQTENVFIEHKTKFCLKTFGELRPKVNCQTSYHQEFISLVNYYDLLICRYSEVCSFVCNTKDELKYHIQELHENEEGLYRCLKCDEKTFKNKVNLAIHSRNYCWKTMELQILDGKLLECRVDNCTFSSYSVPEWHVHLVSHSYRGTRTPFECNRCHVFLSTRITQMEHEQYFCPLLKNSTLEKKE